ncbi:MAG TPA: hypothetical protein VFR07_13785, partial [Mycobacteriales bacterium]|nr:hypothetical protein [Mycobacteriales bacterium]
MLLRPSSLLASSLLAGVLVAAAAGAAAAHPLGNFTVSHYHGLTLAPDGVEVHTVIDVAEIPTQQRRAGIDSDADGALSAAELGAEAGRECPAVAADLTATVDGARLGWTVDAVALEVVPGEADLPTLRLTCDLSAPADLGARASVNFTDGYRTDRIGWHEVTAVGVGMRLVESSVPSTSVSDRLRSYPSDLLSSPLDVRSAAVVAEPGRPVAGRAGPAADPAGSFSRLVAEGDRRLGDLVGDRQLTPLVGALAVALAALLGAGHAVLPGHGKTVMAAYLAGRRGRPRDALLVGATVTLTHTAGVLLLGLALTLSSGLAGERVLRVLTVVSGLLVVVIGAGLLRGALRDRA